MQVLDLDRAKKRDPLARYSPWFYAAAFYNVLWGGMTVLFPRLFFQMIGMAVPDVLPLWQCIGMFVLVYAPAYWWAGRYPSRYGHLILVGLLGKILGPIGLVWAVVHGQLPLAFGLTNLTNDLFWWPAFALYLRAAARLAGGWWPFLLGEERRLPASSQEENARSQDGSLPFQPYPSPPLYISRIVQILLASPFHKLMSHQTMVLTLYGKKTGKAYTFPVTYLQEGRAVFCLTRAAWWKNLRDGAHVKLRLRGRVVSACAELVFDQALIAPKIARIVQMDAREAKYFGVRLNHDGRPDPASLQLSARHFILIRFSPLNDASCNTGWHTLQ